MSKEALAALQTQFDSLELKFSKAFPDAPDDKGGDGDGGEGEGSDDKYAALDAKFTALTEQFNKLAESKDDKAGAGDADDKYAELKKDLADLTTQFKTAMGEQEGTDAGEETGSEDLQAYI